MIRARRRRQSSRHRLVGIYYQPHNQQNAAGDQNERYQSFRDASTAAATRTVVAAADIDLSVEVRGDDIVVTPTR